MKRQGRKILLFSDNAPAHPKVELDNGFTEDVFSVYDLPVSGEGSCNDDDDDNEIPLAVLQLSQDLFGCEFSEPVRIDQSVATQGSTSVD